MFGRTVTTAEELFEAMDTDHSGKINKEVPA